MKFIPTSIPEVVLIEPKVFGDSRGFFMETWNKKVFAEGGINAHFVQDGHSRSAKGVLRGLHYQIENTQGKLIRVIAGEIFDVVVDIRRSSPSFGSWVSVRLNALDRRMLWIPPGFAHGFYVLSEFAEVLYNLTNFYSPEHERCILWSDPDLAIDWPLEGPPGLSGKDTAGVHFMQAEVFS
jgi:dTDP-4-dehydrorhamnose 3,5-epimerase